MLVLLTGAPPSTAQDTQTPEVIRLPAGGGEASPQQRPARPAIVASSGVQESLADLWLRRKALLEKNDLAAARRQVDLMRDVLRREGSLIASDMAGAFLAEGNRALGARNRTRALESFHLASEFSPDDPGAYFGVARTLWSQERDFAGAAGALLQGLRASLRHPGARAALLGNLIMALLLGSVAAACLWILLGTLRTVRLGHHDLYESTLKRLSAPAARGVAWGICLLPALLWLSGWWLLAYLLILSLPYLTRRERLLSFVASGCLLIALPVLFWVDRETASATNPSGRILLESAGSANPERTGYLEKLTAQEPGVSLYHFLLAQAYHASGSMEASLQEYRQVQNMEPGNARAWINSGNLFFSRDQFAQAAEEYHRATQADPESAIAYYNLSLALQGALRLEEADQAFKRARELDNSLITSTLASGSGDGSRQPVEVGYSAAEVLETQKKIAPRHSASRSWIRPWISPMALAGALGLLGCLILPHMAATWGLGRAQRCRRCGEPFCRKCQVGMRREEGLCTACRHLYVLKDPVAPDARARRERKVAAHERWEWISRRLVSLVLPGAGQIHGGRTLWGAALLWLACIGGASLVLAGRTLAYPGIPVMDGTLVVRIAAVGMIGTAWLLANTVAFEKRS